jgi:thioredoxin reductase
MERVTKMNKEYDLIVIGGGSAGCSAALAAKSKGLKNILIIEKEKRLGGILNQCIHNGFGLSVFKEELTGPEYASRVAEQVKEAGIDVVLNAEVTLIEKGFYVTFFSEEFGKQRLSTKSIVLATGSYERNAGAILLPGERPPGILTAGQAQLLMNVEGYLVGRRVFILGSGDIGLIMARRMTLEGAKVLGVAEIMPYSNGLNRNIVQCLEDYNIPLYLSHTVSSVRGRKRLERIGISKVDENFNIIPNTEKNFEVDTLLLAVGLLPLTPLLEQLGIKFSKSRGAIVDEQLETEIPGLFVAGNCLHIHDLADEATKEGELAGLMAANYVLNGKTEKQSILEVTPGKNVNYVIPNFVHYPSLLPSITLRLRVRKPLKKCELKIFVDDKEIYKRVFPFLIPSEMLTINLPSEKLEKGEKLVVNIEELE